MPSLIHTSYLQRDPQSRNAVLMARRKQIMTSQNRQPARIEVDAASKVEKVASGQIRRWRELVILGSSTDLTVQRCFLSVETCFLNRHSLDRFSSSRRR